MVDMGLQEQGRLFTANDCAVGGDESILLITGYCGVRMILSTTILIFLSQTQYGRQEYLSQAERPDHHSSTDRLFRSGRLCRTRTCGQDIQQSETVPTIYVFLP